MDDILPDALHDGLPNHLRGQSSPAEYSTETLNFSATFVGANRVAPVGLEQSETVFNYFIGSEENWHSDVPSFEAVAYEELYYGIDLYARGLRSSLKYEFHVAPGADYTQIAVRYEGIAGLALTEDGSLAVHMGGDWGAIIDAVPYIYQEIDGRDVEVAGRYVLLDEYTYAFDIAGAFDATQALIIDPDLGWATYLGGSGDDRSYGIGVDAAGNVLITGQTHSTDFHEAENANKGQGDAFVAKVSPAGLLQWVTYLGGSGFDVGREITVDAAGNALITGHTDSRDFSGATNGYGGGTSTRLLPRCLPPVHYSGQPMWEEAAESMTEASRSTRRVISSCLGKRPRPTLPAETTAIRGVTQTTFLRSYLLPVCCNG